MQKLTYTLVLLVCVTTAYAQVSRLTDFTSDQFNTNSVVVSGERIYFSADDGTTGEELYYHDLTTGDNQLVADINPGGGIGIGGNIIGFQGGVLFRADDGTSGAELWFSDGTAAGTRLVKDINPGGGSFPEDLTIFNNEAYFAANDGTTGKELWKTDGTTAGTVLVKDINPGGDGTPANSRNIYGHNGTVLFFRADDGTTGSELYLTDGTTGGTRQIADLFAGSDGGLSETHPDHAAIFNGTLYFRGHDGGAATGKELRYYDVTDDEIKLVAEINPGPTAQADVKNLFAVNDKLFFRAKQGSDGVEPYVTDGTAAGTIRLADANSGNGSSNPVYFSGDASTGNVYFRAQGSNGNTEPWISDGTPAGTREIADVHSSGSSNPTFLGVAEGLAYFTGTTAEGSAVGNVGRELFATDGDQVFLIADLNPGSSNSDPVGYQTFLPDGQLLFTTNNSGLGKNLYSYTSRQVLTLDELNDFGAVNVGETSAPQSFTIDVSNLTGELTVTPTTSFEVSLTETGGYTSDNLVLSPAAGGSINQGVFVRFVPDLPTTYDAAITVSGVDIVEARIAVTGEGVSSMPTGLFVFDVFDDGALPDGWAEGEDTDGHLTVSDGTLRIDYDPELPTVTGTRTFPAGTDTVYLNFIYNTNRNTMNGPASLLDDSGNIFAQVRFRAGIQLITGLDEAGDPTGFISLIDQTLVPRNIDVALGLVIDLTTGTVSAKVNDAAVPEGQDVPFLQPATELAGLEFTLPYMFSAGRVLVDELLIGNVFLWDLRRNILFGADLAASANAGTQPGTYPQAALTLFLAAITQASDDFITLEDQTAIDAATAALEAAIDTFINSINKVEATITVDTNEGHDLQNGVFGYNSRAIDQAWSFRNPEYAGALRAADAGWLRYLSGTIGNPFNMNTGMFEPEWVEQFGRVGNQVAAERRVRVKGPQLVSDLYRTLGQAGAKLIVTWPGFMSGPEEAGLFAKFCADNDIIVEYWQLQNEPFFFLPGRNEYFYQDGDDYAAKSHNISDAIKANYPGAQTAPMAAWGVNFDDNFSLGIRDYEPRWYDLVSYHSYAAFNNANPSDELAIRNAHAGMQIGGTDAPNKLAAAFGEDTRFFVTEFNVFNNTLGGTYYAGVYNAEILLRSTRFPGVEYMGLHVLNGSVVIPQFNHNAIIDDAFYNGTPLNTDTISYGFHISSQGEAILIAANAVNDSDFAYQTTVTGGIPVGAEHANSLVDEIPSVMAQAYRGIDSRDYLVFTNKSDIPHEITIAGLDLPDDAVVAAMAAENPIVNSGVEPRSDTLDLTGGTLVVPGYSITRISWEVTMRAPAAPRLYRNDITPTGVNLSWWMVDNAASYRINYGSTADDLTDEVTISGGDVTSYTLPLSAGDGVYATVTAVNAAGESEASNPVAVTYQKPLQPRLVSVRAKDSTVTLLWESVRNANGYEIAYGTTENQLTTLVDARNASGFTLEGLQNDQAYFFSVRAYNGLGQGDPSNVMSGTPKATLPFAPIHLRGSANEERMVDLVWTENDFLFGGTFNLYRSTTPWEGYQLIARDLTELAFTDDLSGQSGVFYYTVKTENEAGESFYPSNIFTIDIERPTSSGDSYRTNGGELGPGSVLLQGNPIRDVARLIIPAMIPEATYRVFDPAGRQLLEGDMPGTGQQDIRMDLPAGTYFLSVNTRQGDRQVFKIIKQ